MHQAFAILAGLIHVYIFVMESLLWGSPRVNRAFGVNAETAETNRLFAFNQGFYNLFLSIGAVGGAVLTFTGHEVIGHSLLLYACFSMLGAALVLVSSERRLLRPALIQGLPPALSIVAWAWSSGWSHFTGN